MKAVNGRKRQPGDGETRRNRRKRRTGQFEAETKDQNRIEHRIDETPGDHHVHGPPAIAMCAQDGPAHDAHQKNRQTGKNDLHVVDRQFLGLARRTKRTDKLRNEEPDTGGKDRTHQNPDQKARRRTLPRQRVIPLPERPRHESAAGNRHAYAERAGKEQDGPGITYRRGELGLAQHGDEDHVDEIDKKHRHKANRRGQRHHRDMAKQSALEEFRLICHAWSDWHDPPTVASGNPTARASASSLWPKYSGVWGRAPHESA